MVILGRSDRVVVIFSLSKECNLTKVPKIFSHCIIYHLKWCTFHLTIIYAYVYIGKYFSIDKEEENGWFRMSRYYYRSSNAEGKNKEIDLS